MAFLCADDMDDQEMMALVKDNAWPDDALIMAFAPSRFRFDVYKFDKAFLTETDQGRIFSDKGELRWRRIGERRRVVYLGEAPPGGMTDCTETLKGHEPEIIERILWGKRTDSQNEWVEQQTPHRFQYPVFENKFSQGYAVLKIENWLDATGAPRFARYHSLTEMKGAN